LNPRFFSAVSIAAAYIGSVFGLRLLSKMREVPKKGDGRHQPAVAILWMHPDLCDVFRRFLAAISVFCDSLRALLFPPSLKPNVRHALNVAQFDARIDKP
jgi:hypothetical protein